MIRPILAAADTVTERSDHR